MTQFCRYIKFLNCRKYQKEQGFQNKLEMYKILYQAYADEIKNLWQRSIFLGAFMTLAWGGYGALQLKMIEKSVKELCGYYFASLGLCVVIIILSFLWIAMAKGSKFVQETHEWHILKNLNFDKAENDIKKLFCKLDDYEYLQQQNDQDDTHNKTINPNLNPNFFFTGVLQAYRYSPSKINIALGWVSVLIAFILSAVHIIMMLYHFNKLNCPCAAFAILFMLMILFFISCRMTRFLKGGKPAQSENLETNTQNKNSTQGDTDKNSNT